MQDQTKTTLSIKMLTYLNDGRVWKVSELAKKLGTNPRNITEYRKAIEAAGYIIISKPGKYGGIQLEKNNVIPSLKMTQDEKRILQVANDYLKARKDFLDYDLYQNAMSKIFASMKTLPLTDETFIIPGVTLLMSNEELHTRYTAIEHCIKHRKKLAIDFLSAENVVQTRVIHPYELFMYNNAWFVIGHCEFANDTRYFKLNRIKRFEVFEKEKAFTKKLSYKRSDYFDEKGFKVGVDWSNNATGENEWVHVKLQFTGKPAMYVQEYKYGENQEITLADKNTTILQCDMMYRYNTIKFVLGFGTDCKVLEPAWLKQEVKSIAEQIAKQ